MKKFLLGIAVALVVVAVFRFCDSKKSDNELLVADSELILKQIKNVGKLVVTEGQYAQIFDYKSSRDLLFGLTYANKKALIVANAKATISYDLSEIETKIDEENKILYITHIPEPELNIYPDIEFYDIKQDYLNQFKANDHNKIKRKITERLRAKIEASDLRSNAENRLISELSKIYIVTNSLGWELRYDQTVIEDPSDFDALKL